MNNETTYWQYSFIWKGAACEAKDGFIFINGRQVTEFSGVNRSSQTLDRFFVEDIDVTDIATRYLETPTNLKTTEIEALAKDQISAVSPLQEFPKAAAKEDRKRLLKTLLSAKKRKESQDRSMKKK